MDELREDGNNTPMIIAGNKADLERKRAVASNEVKHAMLTYAVPHFEISVALNHDVDDLLVGIIAEIKESLGAVDALSAEEVTCPVPLRSDSANREPEDFRAAIRRFSQRKKRQMGAASGLDLEATKCANLSPSGLFERFRQWRRGTPKC
ncbi:Protein Y52B11A.4 [Aphelenchoides avenae]|nr:Protein Y52B11A.4 [Aphelenchus avenae]